MVILVTGGAGFIGSHVVDRLVDEGYDVIVVDNLTSGRREYVNENAKFYQLDLAKDTDKLLEIFRENDIEEVWHIAANQTLELEARIQMRSTETTSLQRTICLRL